MSENIINGRDFSSEFVFSASNSSGPGGQNVNKVNTKIELRFNIYHSIILTVGEKDIILNKLSNRITKSGDLVIVSQDERTQLKNKTNAIQKFYVLMKATLKKNKKRKPTIPTLASKEKRLTDKRFISEKKENRKKREE